MISDTTRHDPTLCRLKPEAILTNGQLFFVIRDSSVVTFCSVAVETQRASAQNARNASQSWVCLGSSRNQWNVYMAKFCGRVQVARGCARVHKALCSSLGALLSEFTPQGLAVYPSRSVHKQSTRGGTSVLPPVDRGQTKLPSVHF